MSRHESRKVSRTAGRAALSLVLMVPLILAAGCGSTGRSVPRSSSLSDAARQADDDSPRKRPLVVREKEREHGPSALLSVLIDTDRDDCGAERHRRMHPRSRRTGSFGYQPDLRFYFGGSWIGGRSDLWPDARLRGGSVNLGVDADRRFKAEMEMTYRGLDPYSGHRLDLFQRQEEWLLGGNLRFTFAAPRQAVRPYVLVGGNGGVRTWQYREPIEIVSVDHWGDPVSHGWAARDHLTTGSAYLGAGASFLNTRHLEVGANARLGYQFYAGTTDLGLTNDLFDPHRIATVALEFSILP